MYSDVPKHRKDIVKLWTAYPHRASVTSKVALGELLSIGRVNSRPIPYMCTEEDFMDTVN